MASASCSNDGYGSLSSRSDLGKANYCLTRQAEAVSCGRAARERANWVPDWPGRSLEDPPVHVAQRGHASIVQAQRLDYRKGVQDSGARRLLPCGDFSKTFRQYPRNQCDS
jgi:hypothetical protein